MIGHQQLCCGNCGHYGFRVFKFSDRILASECMQCKSTSSIMVTVPKIVIGFGENSGGILCEMAERTGSVSPVGSGEGQR